MGVRFTFSGADQAARKFQAIRERAPRELKNAAKRIGTMQARGIKAALRRKRTGLLHKSIGSKVAEGKKGKLTILAGPRKGFRTVVVSEESRKLVGLRGTKRQHEKTPEKLKKVKLRRGGNVREGAVLDPARYAHLADKGHKKGKGKGAAQGQNFMRAARDSTDAQAIEIAREAVRQMKGA